MVEDSKKIHPRSKKHKSSRDLERGAEMDLRWYKKTQCFDTDVLRIYVKSIDSCNLMTNLHTTLLPKLFRFKHCESAQADCLRLVLSETDDVLCSIGVAYKELLPKWKKSWKSFISAIYDYTYLGEDSLLGRSWSTNPASVVNKLEDYFKAAPEMSLFKDIVKSKLLYNIKLEEEYKTKRYKDILKKNILERTKKYKNLKIYAHHHGCQCIYSVLEDLSEDEQFKKKKISLIFLEPFFYRENKDIANVNKILIYDCYKTLDKNREYLSNLNYPLQATIEKPAVKYKRTGGRIKYYYYVNRKTTTKEGSTLQKNKSKFFID